MKSLFNNIDSDNSGTIDFHEFKEFLPKFYESLDLRINIDNH